VLDVVGSRLLAEPADGHVLQHAAAQTLIGFSVIGVLLVVRFGVTSPRDPQDRALPNSLPRPNHPDRSSPNHAATVMPAPQAGARAPLFSDPIEILARFRVATRDPSHRGTLGRVAGQTDRQRTEKLSHA
jgi:hypothetical protein